MMMKCGKGVSKVKVGEKEWKRERKEGMEGKEQKGRLQEKMEGEKNEGLKEEQKDGRRKVRKD